MPSPQALPNAISLARALAVVPVLMLLAEAATILASLAVFCVAALTDAVDGPLARRIGATSRLGAFLDPLADKVLVLGTLVALWDRGAVDAWVVLLILGRDLLVTAVRGLAAGRGMAVEASAYGKVKAVVLAIAVAGLLLAVALPSAELAALAAVVLAAALGLTLASGVDVVVRAAGLLMPASGRLRVHAR